MGWVGLDGNFKIIFEKCSAFLGTSSQALFVYFYRVGQEMSHFPGVLCLPRVVFLGSFLASQDAQEVMLVTQSVSESVIVSRLD